MLPLAVTANYCLPCGVPSFAPHVGKVRHNLVLLQLVGHAEKYVKG